MSSFTNRIIYQSQAVALKIGAASYKVLDGVQSVNYGVEVAREDVYQFGKLTAADRISLEAPAVTAEVSMYYPNFQLLPLDFTNLLKNSIIGSSNSSLAIGHDKEAEDFMSHQDVTVTVINAANMSSFGFEASVGAIPTLTLGFEGTSLNYTTDAIGVFGTNNAKVDENGTLAGKLIPFTGVVISLDDSGNLTHFSHAQSANLSFDLGFEGLQQLGNANGMQYARVATLPATASLDVEAIAIDRGMGITLINMHQKASAGGTTGKMNDGARRNVSLLLNNAIGVVTHTFKLQLATLDSSNYTASMGDNATCSATFGVSISTSDETDVTSSQLLFI